MASIGITASIQIACNSHHVTKKQKPLNGSASSFGTKQSTTHFVSLEIEGKNGFPVAEEREKSTLLVEKPGEAEGEVKEKTGGENSGSKMFDDLRWKNGTWDLNIFVKNGRMDWDGVIVAEARRRKFLEVYPEVATTQDPVVFRSSIIPWWAPGPGSSTLTFQRLSCSMVILKLGLRLLRWNLIFAKCFWHFQLYIYTLTFMCFGAGRAAMVGFFAAYMVDVLTGLDLVGQTGNFLCKAGLFLTVVGIILFRRKEDFVNIQKLADEASFYDKQWQASWQDQESGTAGTPKQTAGKK